MNDAKLTLVSSAQPGILVNAGLELTQSVLSDLSTAYPGVKTTFLVHLLFNSGKEKYYRSTRRAFPIIADFMNQDAKTFGLKIGCEIDNLQFGLWLSCCPMRRNFGLTYSFPDDEASALPTENLYAAFRRTAVSLQVDAGAIVNDPYYFQKESASRYLHLGSNGDVLLASLVPEHQNLPARIDRTYFDGSDGHPRVCLTSRVRVPLSGGVWGWLGYPCAGEPSA